MPCASHNLRIRIPETVATNTLIVTNLERATFHPENLKELRAHLELHGKIYKIVPIKSFNRILVIFFQSNDAIKAKAYCDRIEFLGKNIRIYYGPSTPIHDEIDGSRHLNVPEHEKNWLVSPPGSPPVGWTQIREDRPNSNTLASDLVHALANVNLTSDISEFSLDDNTNHIDIPRMQPPILTVIPCDSDSDSYSYQNNNNKVPLILIQDWDDSGSQDTRKANLPKRNNYNLQQTRAQLHPSLMHRPPTSTPRLPLLFS